MSSDVEQIKSKLSIADVVGGYIDLKPAGKNYKACCPFHNEKTPSFMVSPERQSFYCFGCGQKGDIFSFVQEFEGLEFPKALEMLAERAGVTLTKQVSKNPEEKKRDELGYIVLEDATQFYEAELKKNNATLSYLKKRGLSDELIEAWRIGAAPDAWRDLKTYLLQKPIFKDNEKLLLDVGLVKEGSKGESYDTFRNRIQFPLCNEAGKVLGFTGRSLDDSEPAKYLNSPDTYLFTKSEVLYGFHHAKTAMRKNNFSILVEGQFDVIASHAMGFKNTVATSGTAISEQQLTLLKRLSNNLVIALDGDEAGFKASKRVWELALPLGMDVKIANLPKGSDPGDLLEAGQADEWKSLIKNAKHVIEFVTNKVVGESKDRRILLQRVHAEVVPLINTIESDIEKTYFIEYVAKVAQLDMLSIKKEVDQSGVSITAPKKSNSAAASIPEKTSHSAHQFLKNIALLILWQEQSDNALVSKEKIDSYKKRFVQDLGEALSQKYLSLDLTEYEVSLYDFEESYLDEATYTKTLNELLFRLHQKILKRKQDDLQHIIAKHEASKDTQALEESLKELQKINTEIEKQEGETATDE